MMGSTSERQSDHEPTVSEMGRPRDPERIIIMIP